VSTLIQCTAVVPGSQVGRPSHLKDPGPGLPPAFIITPGQYLVPPHSSFSFTLEYRARFAGNRDIEVFKFRTEGGNEQQMSVCAQAFGPWVVPCTESINFGDVNAGQSKTLVLDLRNDSDMDGDFHILGEREDYAWFQFSEISGTVLSRTIFKIFITLHARCPMNYHKRVFLAIHNQGIFYVDLLGTGFTAKKRPAQLFQRHVDAAREREQMQLHLLAVPDSLANTLSLKQRQQDLEALNHATTESESFEHGNFEPWSSWIDEMFDGNVKGLEPVSISRTSVWFGCCPRSEGVPGYETFLLTNNTKGKVTVQWHPRPNGNFGVYPTAIDIKAGSSAEFNVSFRPPIDDQLYHETLECYAYFKTNRTFRLVTDKTFSPPWCIRLRAFANTFRPPAPLLQGDLIVSHQEILFAPTAANCTAHASLKFRNPTFLALTWRQRPIIGDKYFSIHPSAGLIRPKSFQIVTCRYVPKSEGYHRATLTIEVNQNNSQVYKIPLRGSSFEPNLVLPNECKFWMKPTCLGRTCARTLTVRNPTGTKLGYRWALGDVTPRGAGAFFSVSPEAGIVHGYDEIEFNWTYSPESIGKHFCIVPLFCYTIPRNKKRKKVLLRIRGECLSSAVTLNPPRLDFGPVLAENRGSGDPSHSRSLTIKNRSNGDLRYTLHFDQLEPNFESGSLERANKSLPSLIWSNMPEGLLPARTDLKVLITVNPQYSGYHRYRVRCSVTDDSGQHNEIMVAEITAMAEYPRLRIADCRKLNTSHDRV